MTHTEASKTDRQPRPHAEALIIDNDPSHAQTVAESLERIGFACSWPRSGTEGARRVEEQEFDVIITDLMMNDVDGLEILARAKKEQPDAEVILITGHGTMPSAVEAMQQGAFNYLLKPLDMAQLRAVTREGRRTVRGCGGPTSN